MDKTVHTTLMHLHGRVGDSWAKVQGNYFLLVPTVQGILQGFGIRILTHGRFSIAKGRAKSKVLTSSLSPGVGFSAVH